MFKSGFGLITQRHTHTSTHLDCILSSLDQTNELSVTFNEQGTACIALNRFFSSTRFFFFFFQFRFDHYHFAVVMLRVCSVPHSVHSIIHRLKRRRSNGNIYIRYVCCVQKTKENSIGILTIEKCGVLNFRHASDNNNAMSIHTQHVVGMDICRNDMRKIAITRLWKMKRFTIVQLEIRPRRMLMNFDACRLTKK